jgi:hypothetical protein
MHIFRRERGLADAAETVNRRLCDRRRAVGVHEQLVQLAKAVVAAGEIQIARRHILEQPFQPRGGNRAAFNCSDDALTPFARVLNAHQIGKDDARQQPGGSQASTRMTMKRRSLSDIAAA